MSIPFIKMHGLGNDFVLIDDLGKPQGLCQPLKPELARQICDRRLGVGADQILWLKTPIDSHSDARMEIFNSDGSTAEMCGNGIRAAGLYLYRHGPKRKPSYCIETLAGLKLVEMSEEGANVSVDMGQPELGVGMDQGGERLVVLGIELRFFEVDMGNPHAVFFVENLDRCEVERLGPAIEVDPRFPRRTNVEFVEVMGPGLIRVRVWERGAGLTLACGTGACASAVAALATARVHGKIEVQLPGGSLWVRWDRGSTVIMEGPAEEVFRGEFLA